MVLSMETGSARFSRRHPEHYSTLPADHEEILRASLRGAVEVMVLKHLFRNHDPNGTLFTPQIRH
jgi:hypothetical protein